MHQVGAFLEIGRDKWQVFLQFRIALTRRPNRKIEQLLCWLGGVALEDDRAESHQRTFVDLEPQAIARFDRVTHIHFYVAVFPVKDFEEKSEIISARCC